jgi:hypothetical protein
MTIEAPARAGSVHRTAAIGALVAAACYLAQPLLVIFAAMPEYPTAAEQKSLSWIGPYQTVFFAGVGIGTLILVTAIRRLVGDGTGARVAERLGLAAAFGWFVTAGFSWAAASALLSDVAEVTGDLSVQRAIVLVANQGPMAGVVVSSIGLAGWLGWLAVAGRRAGIVGPFLAVAAWLVVLSTAGPLLAGFPPFGLPVLIIFMIALGVSMLRRSRAA